MTNDVSRKGLIMFSDRMWEQSLREATVIEELHFTDHLRVLVTSDKPVGHFIYPFRMFFFRKNQKEPILALNLEFSGGKSCFLGVHDSEAHYNYGKTDPNMSIEDFKGWALRTASQYLSSSPDSSDAHRDEPIKKKLEVASLEGSVDLNALAQQFTGAKFGELVLHHYKNADPETVIKGMMGTIEELPQDVQPSIEHWIDEIGAFGSEPAFWKYDCGESFKIICNSARLVFANLGIQETNDQLLSMFNIIVLNFAYSAHKHPQTKAFIQKSMGKGFIRRLFS